jgi:Bacterial PH domain
MSTDEQAEVAAASPKRAQKMLPMQSGEEVILSASPSRAANLHKYLYTLGFYGIWRKRNTAVVTSRRLLISRGVFRREEHSIAISDIDSARYTRRWLNSYALVTIGGRARRRTEEIGPMSARTARGLVGEILSRR